MEIKVEKKEKLTIVSLKGRLDATTATELEDALSKLVAQNTLRMLIDLHELDYISSAGLRVLLSIAKQLKKLSGTVAVSALNESVGQVFEISGFKTIFPIYKTTQEGLQSMGA